MVHFLLISNRTQARPVFKSHFRDCTCAHRLETKSTLVFSECRYWFRDRGTFSLFISPSVLTNRSLAVLSSASLAAPALRRLSDSTRSAYKLTRQVVPGCRW